MALTNAERQKKHRNVTRNGASNVTDTNEPTALANSVGRTSDLGLVFQVLNLQADMARLTERLDRLEAVQAKTALEERQVR